MDEYVFEVLQTLAAIASIVQVLLELWREYKRITDDGGR